ncbi:MAG: ABC transporter ATP-binding protein [Planctomycetes bacterium]|nr:ABC transporter ATP-binding protein [Planctomycetota bacterium]
MFKNLRLFLPLLKGHYKKYIIASLALFVVDVIDVYLPILTGLAVNITVGGIIGTTNPTETIRRLGLLLLAYIGGILIQGFLRYWWRYLYQSASLLVANNIRNKLFGHLQKLSMNFFHNARTGDIMSRATNDVEWVKMFLGDGAIIIVDIFFYFIMVPFIMIGISPSLTLYTVLSCSLLPFLVWAVGKRMHAKGTQVQESMSGISQSAEENFSGVRVVKSFAQEANQLDRFREANDIYLKKNLSLAKLSSYFHPFLGFNVGVTAFVILFFGGIQVIDGQITPGDLVTFMQLLGRIAWPMVGLGMSVRFYQFASASMKRLEQILNIQPEVEDRGASPVPETSDVRVEFRDVNFSHKIPELSQDGLPQQDKCKVIQVLKNINLKIPANSIVAITGPIGSGKTTLLNLLVRFYDGDSGEIMINGINIKNYSVKNLRSLMGVVPQDVFLFSDTIRNNITFGLDDPASDETISNTAGSVVMREAIDSIPQKYEAYLGERGINLSGGQRQRVSLARALIKNPPLLILDDCFSAVDYETERTILRNIIANKSQSQTVLVVSHRLAVMSMADLIVFMDKGEIIEQGTHSELLAKNNAYARFCEYQNIKEQLEEI